MKYMLHVFTLVVTQAGFWVGHGDNFEVMERVRLRCHCVLVGHWRHLEDETCKDRNHSQIQTINLFLNTQ